jgi:hypothetical protein
MGAMSAVRAAEQEAARWMGALGPVAETMEMVTPDPPAYLAGRSEKGRRRAAAPAAAR